MSATILWDGFQVTAKHALYRPISIHPSIRHSFPLSLLSLTFRVGKTATNFIGSLLKHQQFTVELGAHKHSIIKQLYTELFKNKLDIHDQFQVTCKSNN
jgi:hypothetical protein